MNLIVASHPEAIADAIELEKRTEAATVESVFAEILARTAAALEPYGPWIHQADHEINALRRHREAVVPRLRAIAEGLGGEDEPARVYAAAVLGRVDPPVGFRALARMLRSDEPTTLHQAMGELQSVVITADEDRRGRADLVVEPDEMARLLSFVDHPDEKVAGAAIWLLDELKAPGLHDHCFLPRMDDPALGQTIRWLLAWEGRPPILLDRAFAALGTPGRAEVDGHSLELLEGFRRSGDPLNRPRALAMMNYLLAGDALLPGERETIEMHLRWDANGREAMRPEHLEKAIAQVDRLVSAGIIDRASGDRAVTALRSDEEGNHDLSDAWGAIEAFRAAGLLHGINFKGSDYPPAHDELLHDLAAIGRGAFQPEGVFQLREPWIDDGQVYPVQFVHGGRLYRFDIGYHRASYDADSVLEAANEALADAGEPGRFVVLGVTCPQEIAIAFCDPSALEPIAGELGLKPRVPFATTVGRMARVDDASRHRVWDRIALAIGDTDRSLSVEEIVRWRCPTTGETALHRAVIMNLPSMCQLLLDRGADVNAADDRAYTPLDLAVALWRGGHLLDLLRNRGGRSRA